MLPIFTDLCFALSIFFSPRKVKLSFIAPEASAEGACIFSRFGYYRSFVIGYYGSLVIGYYGSYVTGYYRSIVIFIIEHGI